MVSVPYEITLLSNGLAESVKRRIVSVPYEITLLSNTETSKRGLLAVSVPYEITLLSNSFLPYLLFCFVSVPYEITLLSNYNLTNNDNGQFQYLMKLHYSQTSSRCANQVASFSTL